jgi:hypothetical protein
MFLKKYIDMMRSEASADPWPEGVECRVRLPQLGEVHHKAGNFILAYFQFDAAAWQRGELDFGTIDLADALDMYVLLVEVLPPAVYKRWLSYRQALAQHALSHE